MQETYYKVIRTLHKSHYLLSSTWELSRPPLVFCLSTIIGEMTLLVVVIVNDFGDISGLSLLATCDLDSITLPCDNVIFFIVMSSPINSFPIFFLLSYFFWDFCFVGGEIGMSFTVALAVWNRAIFRLCRLLISAGLVHLQELLLPKILLVALDIDLYMGLGFRFVCSTN